VCLSFTGTNQAGHSKGVWPVVIVESEVALSRRSIAIRLKHHCLISLIFVEADVAPAVTDAILILLAAEDQTSILGTFFIIEEHACGIAICPGVLLTQIVGSGELGIVRNNHAGRPIWLDDIDSMNRDLIEVRIASGLPRTHEDCACKRDGKDSGVGGEKVTRGEHGCHLLIQPTFTIADAAMLRAVLFGYTPTRRCMY